MAEAKLGPHHSWCKKGVHVSGAEGEPASHLGRCPKECTSREPEGSLPRTLGGGADYMHSWVRQILCSTSQPR